MLAGSIATVVGMLWLLAGQVLALLTWPLLVWLLGAARWLAQVPGAYTTLPPFSVWWVWGYYGLVAFWLTWSQVTVRPGAYDRFAHVDDSARVERAS